MAREAWSLSLVTCHARFSRRGIDPVGETANVNEPPLGSRRLLFHHLHARAGDNRGSFYKKCVDRGCRHRTTSLCLRKTLRKQLPGRQPAMPGVWGRFALCHVFRRREFMGSMQQHAELPCRGNSVTRLRLCPESEAVLLKRPAPGWELSGLEEDADDRALDLDARRRDRLG